MLAPALFMVTITLMALKGNTQTATLWRLFKILSISIVAIQYLLLLFKPAPQPILDLFKQTHLGLILALLVQFLSLVIAQFSARYLEGEEGQSRYVAALAGVIASVHILLIADHWFILILAWAMIGVALQHLLCFYSERPWANLAAYKKRVSDRAADALLILAAILAWAEVGSGSLSDLAEFVSTTQISLPLQLSGLALVLAVALRSASFPTHGWLIQVMEAPTPVSALLHAGVVNLGGFVLIRFAPLLEEATFARVTLLLIGLATALLAAMVMLTRISIKVRLAWSTVAQMGFMLVECALGLYTLAALHLLGHSLYKAHAFLSASDVVRQTRLQFLHNSTKPTLKAFIFSPIVSVLAVLFTTSIIDQAMWPWWWSVIMGLAWAPLLWIAYSDSDVLLAIKRIAFGLATVCGLTMVAIAIHFLPLGLNDTPDMVAGLIVLFSMAALYIWLVLMHIKPTLLHTWRRWSYAGFYVDEAFTRLALQLGGKDWASHTHKGKDQ